MTENPLASGEPIDVLIIGGGPAGLSAATELKQCGSLRVVVLDREAEAGGIPRHCGHPPFGLREFNRVLTGPAYARKLVKTALAAGVELHLSTTVVKAGPAGRLLITTPRGPEEISARRVLYATGVREMPRSARLISGARPLGVLNTGALQSLVYLKHRKPFEHPVIIGTELVSFSAIQTCRHAGIKPVAMIEAGERVTARWPSRLFAAFTRVPLHLDTRLVAIEGDPQVSGVEIETKSGTRRHIACDGVILTGGFTPDAALARSGHLAIDPATGGPLVDQFGRCSDPVYFAAGNVLRPVETSGWSWREGRQCARWIAKDLQGDLPSTDRTLTINTTDPLIKYVMPQKIALPIAESGMRSLQLRFSRPAKGNLIIENGSQIVRKQFLNTYPERRVLIPLKELGNQNDGDRLVLRFEHNQA